MVPCGEHSNNGMAGSSATPKKDILGHFDEIVNLKGRNYLFIERFSETDAGPYFIVFITHVRWADFVNQLLDIGYGFRALCMVRVWRDVDPKIQGVHLRVKGDGLKKCNSSDPTGVKVYESLHDIDHSQFESTADACS